MAGGETVVEWLAGVDPSVRWQVLRDVLGEPEEVWAPVRALVETEGWGARFLALEDADGQWDGGPFLPKGFTRQEWEEVGQPWTATCSTITTLRELGLDPTSASARRTVELVGANSRWEHDGQPFWSGEVEECINGRTVADGAYFGVEVSALVERVVGERLDDGGWNCERAQGSVRSSFATTINVLEGLAGFERATGGTPDPGRRGHPARSSSSSGGSVPAALRTTPSSSCSTRAGGATTCCAPDGTWSLDRTPPGRTWFDVDDGAGRPSPWVTLKALRVLAWVDG